LKNLEYFAYGAQLPAQDQVTRFILSQKGSIEEHLSHREFLEAIAETAKLEGYIARYKEEADTIHISLDGVGQKLIYDTTQRVVQIGNRKIQLTNNEAQLMGFLYRNPDNVHTRDEINQGAWDGRKGDKATFGYTMRGLLNKIQPDNNGPVYVKQFHRNGFMFSSDPNAFSYPKVEYDAESGSVKLEGREDSIDINLKGKKKAVMDFLYSKPNTFHSINDILKGVWWEETERKDRVAINTIFALKRLLIVDAYALSPIVGTPSKGYMLKV